MSSQLVWVAKFLISDIKEPSILSHSSKPILIKLVVRIHAIGGRPHLLITFSIPSQPAFPRSDAEAFLDIFPPTHPRGDSFNESIVFIFIHIIINVLQVFTPSPSSFSLGFERRSASVG